MPTLKRVHLNLKSKLLDEYLSKSSSILAVFCSIFNRLRKNMFLNVFLFILWYYFIVFALKQYRSRPQKNVKSRGGKREVAGRKKSPALAKVTREIYQKHWRANHHCIYLESPRFLDLAKGPWGGNLRKRLELCIMAV